MTPPPKRRLAAVLHADVVGYSALMSANEEGTHADLRQSLTAASDIVSARSGRMIGTAGDAFLADFTSVLDALAAARTFQDHMRAENAARGSDRRLDFRIGINLGDVIDDGDDIFGDGVNVAARIQALAAPGGIAVSGAVHDIARGKTDAQFDDIGEHRVKNIPDPVRVYTLGSGVPAVKKGRRPLPQLVGLAATVIMLVASVLWFAGWIPGTAPREPPSTQQTAAIADARPMIAVLPFDMVGGGDQAYFAAGMTEDIISQLGRFSGVLVLSWNAVAAYKGQAVPLDVLGSDLGVGYVVGGSIWRQGDLFRITVQLSDAANGTLLWSDKYDESATDLFAVQDRISREVVRALAVKLTRVEQQRVVAKSTENLSAYDKVLRGRDLLRIPERDDNLDARAMFQGAVDLDPEYPDAYVGLGLTHNADLLWGWTEFPLEAIEVSLASANRALEIEPDHAAARDLLARILWLQGDYAGARVEIDRALDLNPNDANSLAFDGKLSLLSGAQSEAIDSLELALRLDPGSRTFVISDLAAAYYLEGRYEAAVTLVEQYEQAMQEDPAPIAVRAAALAQLGRDREAAAAAEQARSIYPFFDAKIFADNIVGPQGSQGLVEGLRKAGFD